MTVFVRDLTNEEGNRLLRIARKGADSVQVRRALLILASAQKMKVPEISRLYHISGEHIRHTIHRFNQEGMASLQPKYGGGRPPIFTEEERTNIIELAQIPPKVAGSPFTNWSISKLKQAVEERKIVASISIETLRVILNEPKSPTKIRKPGKLQTIRNLNLKKRIEELYDSPPVDGRVICVDEFGPLSLQPYGGKGWFQQRKPSRLRATYTRPHGVKHMLAALDLKTDKLYGHAL